MSTATGRRYDDDGWPLCERCLSRGFEKRAYTQLVGEWLCQDEYERAIQNESVMAKMQVARNPRK